MSLTNEQLRFLQNAVTTAKQLNIDNLIIEPGKLRAMDENQTIVLYLDSDVPSFDFGSIGFNRLPAFTSRFEIIRSTSGFMLEATTITGEDNTIGYDKVDIKDKKSKQPMWVKVLTMTGLNTSIEYRCANPGLIKAPKVRTDVDKYELSFDETALSIIQKGKMAMKSEVVTISSNSKGVQIILTDENTDTLKYKFAKDVYDLVEEEQTTPTFSYNYDITNIITIFKQQTENVTFKITQRGFLAYIINDINVYVAPIKN